MEVAKLPCLLWLCLHLLSTDLVSSQIYLHMPRGSNNRLDERGRAAQNCDRLFESYNNAGSRGGYNRGTAGPRDTRPPKPYYHEGSQLNIQWTNQHACSDGSAQCTIVLQYMCHDLLRDGNTSARRPILQSACANSDCDTDVRFGAHETYEYYHRCRSTAASPLFGTSYGARDQSLLYSTRRTRQNWNGYCKAGPSYECPEERDYYPYWKPSQWKDIAVVTTNVSHCKHYRAESQNVKAKGYCVLPAPLDRWWKQCDTSLRHYASKVTVHVPRVFGPILHAQDNPASCEALTYNHGTFMATTGRLLPSECRNIAFVNDPTQSNPSLVLRGNWTTKPSHGIPAPECREFPWSDGKLHSGLDGFPNSYNWTVPFGAAHQSCAIRIRHNVTSGDFDPSTATRGSEKNLTFGFSSAEAAQKRGFVLAKYPVVDIFGTPNLPLQLAVSVSNYGGRTFQDRSHAFSIRKRPASVSKGARIYNVQVQGKRGNIVQVFPSVEYDFVPNRLLVSKGDLIHFQWTGSDLNPAANEGEGRSGTDRSNIVLQRRATFDEGSRTTADGTMGSFGTSYPVNLSSTTFLGLNKSTAEALALLKSDAFPNGSMSNVLDDVGPYFDAGLVAAKVTGIYHYMSTRNNNFSHRSQKGRITVIAEKTSSATFGQLGGALSLQNAQLRVLPSTLASLTEVRLFAYDAEECATLLNATGTSLPQAGVLLAECVRLEPQDMITPPGSEFELTLQVSRRLTKSDVSQVNTFGNQLLPGLQSWTQEVIKQVDVQSQTVTFRSRHAGLFVLQLAEQKIPLASFIALGCALAMLLLAVGICLSQKPRERVTAMRHAGFRLLLSVKPRV